MSSILSWYRLLNAVTAGRLSADFAYGPPRLKPPVTIYLQLSVIQRVHHKALGPNACPRRTILPVADLHRLPPLSRQATTPPNLDLFRRGSLPLANELSRDHEHGLAGYRLDALGVKVNIESMPVWASDILVNDPKGGPLQATFRFDVQTRVVVGLHICARQAACEWLLGAVEALANRSPSRFNSRPAQYRTGSVTHLRNWAAGPTNESTVEGQVTCPVTAARGRAHNLIAIRHRPQRS
jgi:hypothetical protein